MQPSYSTYRHNATVTVTAPYGESNGHRTLNPKPTPLSHRPQSDQLPIVDACVGAVTIIVVHPTDGEVAPFRISLSPKLDPKPQIHEAYKHLG